MSTERDDQPFEQGSSDAVGSASLPYAARRTHVWSRRSTALAGLPLLLGWAAVTPPATHTSFDDE